MSRPYRRWSLVACAVLAVLVVVLFLRRGDVSGAEPVVAPKSRVATTTSEFVTPPATELASRAQFAATSATEAAIRPRFGSVVGRVLLHSSFAVTRSYAWLERKGDTEHGASVEFTSLNDAIEGGDRARAHLYLSPDSPLGLRGAELDLDIKDLEPGRYTFFLAYVPDWMPDDVTIGLGAYLRNLAVLSQVDIAAGEPTHDPRLEPLDLRTRWMRASYTLFDDDSVARRDAPCHVLTDAGDDEEPRTDDFGRIELLLSPRATFVELQPELNLACIVRAPLGAGRIPVIAPRRPLYELHVDPRAIPAGVELALFVRESPEIAGSSPFGRGAVYGRFDVDGNTSVTPRRLGMHELEWRAKARDGSTLAFVDVTRTLDVRTAGDAQRVDLELPIAVREALR